MGALLVAIADYIGGALEAIIVSGVAALVLWLALGQAFASIPPDAEHYRRDLVRNARLVWGLDAPVATFAAQIHQESRYRADAESPAGALGLAQFMPATARWIAGAYPAELGTNEPLNPSWALRALVRYDRHLYERVRIYDTGCDRMLFTLSDYNGGAGWRIKRQRMSGNPGNYAVISRLNPGIHPANQRENEEYPRRIVYRWQPLYLSWGSGVCLA